MQANPSATGSSDAPILTEFKLFDKLPTDVRYIIWDLYWTSMDEPETLVCCPSLLQSRLISARPPRPVPLILQICRETRYEYLAQIGTVKSHPTYRLCGGLSINPHRRDVRLYVNMKADIVLAETGRKTFS
jgi:hypothetical protein